MEHSKMQKRGFVILRLGMAVIFMWFGSQQLLHPDQWTSFVPNWAASLFWDTNQLVLINGLFEVIGAVLLISNVFTRIVALVLSLHLAVIAFSLGVNSIAIRDIGLSVATLSLALVHPPKVHKI